MKPGDRVRKLGGDSFSNGMVEATVARISSGKKVWIHETNTWVYIHHLIPVKPAVSLDDSAVI